MLKDFYSAITIIEECVSQGTEIVPMLFNLFIVNMSRSPNTVVGDLAEK